MNVILTGGGTAGHVMPCIALVPELKKRFDHVYYVGSERGMERELAQSAGLEYFSVPTVKLDRAKLWKNVSLPVRLARGIGRARELVRELKPSVVFSKGGYVALPVAIGAKREGVPVVLHESDYTMGVANKLCSRFAKLIMTAFPETAVATGGTCVGIPLRPEFTELPACTRANKQRKTLLVVGGSLGASRLNDFVFSAIPVLTTEYDVVHVTGKGKANPDLIYPHYKQIEFTSHLADLVKCADVVLSRAGATTLFELASLQKPAVLVPLTGRATRGDQILNAQSFERRGYAVVLNERDLSLQSLFSALEKAQRLTLPAVTGMSSAQIADLIYSHASKNT